MSSSDSDTNTRPRRVPAKRAAAASSDSDSDSDSNTRTRAVRGRATRGGAAQAKKDDSDSDSDSSDSEDDKPATRRVAARRTKAGSDSDDSDSEDDDKPTTRGAPAQLWLPINYDDMSQDAFYALLKEKSRQQRQEEKRMAQEVAESQQGEAEEPVERFVDESNIPADGIRGYKYSEMLQRVYNKIRGENSDIDFSSEKRVKLPVPKTEKASTKTTALSNFKQMCKAMNRDMDHVKDFIEKELTTQTNLNSDNVLIMKVRNVKAMQIESVFQKYVGDYVQCHACGGIDTNLKKDPETRLWKLSCKTCMATRTVQAAANATYKAQIGRRKHF